MYTNKKLREQISALKDGALPEADVELAFAAMQASDGKQAWALYHLIGDTLREIGTPPLSPDFNARLAARLAAEPAPVRPRVEVDEPAGLAAVLSKSAST